MAILLQTEKSVPQDPWTDPEGGGRGQSKICASRSMCRSRWGGGRGGGGGGIEKSVPQDAWSSADFFFKKFQEHYQSVKHFVGPDLGPNCLRRLSADGTSRQRFKKCCVCESTI